MPKNIDAVLAQVAPAFGYRYEFGDPWRHAVMVKKFTPSEVGKNRNYCIAGENARPPKVVAGIGGHDECVGIHH